MISTIFQQYTVITVKPFVWFINKEGVTATLKGDLQECRVKVTLKTSTSKTLFKYFYGECLMDALLKAKAFIEER